MTYYNKDEIENPIVIANVPLWHLVNSINVDTIFKQFYPVAICHDFNDANTGYEDIVIIEIGILPSIVHAETICFISQSGWGHQNILSIYTMIELSF